MKAPLWQRQVWMLPISILALGATAALIGAPTTRAGEQPKALPAAGLSVRTAPAQPALPGAHIGWEINPNAITYTDDDRPPTF